MFGNFKSGVVPNKYASKDFAGPFIGFEDFYIGMCFPMFFFWIVFGSSTWLGSKGVVL